MNSTNKLSYGVIVGSSVFFFENKKHLQAHLLELIQTCLKDNNLVMYTRSTNSWVDVKRVDVNRAIMYDIEKDINFDFFSKDSLSNYSDNLITLFYFNKEIKRQESINFVVFSTYNAEAVKYEFDAYGMIVYEESASGNLQSFFSKKKLVKPYAFIDNKFNFHVE